MNDNILITVLSWEDRYILGLQKDIALHNPSKVIVFQYATYTDWKADNLVKTKEILKERLVLIELDISTPSENWFMFLKTFTEHCKGNKIIIDITTMTREAIWLSLYNCKVNSCETSYIYYRPESYSDEWISRDPDKPRLLYKMSGIAKLGAPSLLLITGGYDIQRLDSLIYKFEPKQTILFFQDGDDHRNKENFKQCQELFKAKYNIEMLFEYDAYDIESSYNLIIEKLMQKENGNSETYLDTYNIILNSLGAKTSAIALFKIWLKYPQVALSYIPSKEYNKEYSLGIGQSYTGVIQF